MRALSKSKILAFLQCPKRLWLEVHRRTLLKDSAATEASYASGHQIGEIAQKLYGPEGGGTLIDWEAEGFVAGFARTREAMQLGAPVFEAGFQAEGALSLADVLLPLEVNGERAWRMVEVKSSTSIKDYHLADAAVQSYVARSAGVPLAGLALARLDSSWVYPGGGDYRGLLVEEDVTERALSREDEVRGWIESAQRTVAEPSEPERRTGKHCHEPYDCGFLKYCQSQEPQAEYPVDWLPRRSGKLKQHIEANGIREMRDVPDELLNATQQRVKTATLSGEPYFDREGAARALSEHTHAGMLHGFRDNHVCRADLGGHKAVSADPVPVQRAQDGAARRAGAPRISGLVGQRPVGAFRARLDCRLRKAGANFCLQRRLRNSAFTRVGGALP
jgi:hypothetical protein